MLQIQDGSSNFDGQKDSLPLDPRWIKVGVVAVVIIAIYFALQMLSTAAKTTADTGGKVIGKITAAQQLQKDTNDAIAAAKSDEHIKRDSLEIFGQNDPIITKATSLKGLILNGTWKGVYDSFSGKKVILRWRGKVYNPSTKRNEPLDSAIFMIYKNDWQVAR